MNFKIQRKSLEKILLVNWSRFAAETVKIKDSVLFAGANGTGKSTILDAIIYAVTGCKQFNKAADDKERTVLGYVRGDTKGNGAGRFLRHGQVVSYIALEFYSELENTRFVTGVCIESPDDVTVKSYWFVRKDAAIEDFNFFSKTNGKIITTIRSELCVKGERLKAGAFYNQTNGVEQVMRALGLKNCNSAEYSSKLMRMMAIKPERNINEFIRESVLREKPVNAIEQIREGKQRFDTLNDTYERIINEKKMLDDLEKMNLEYEKARRNADIKRYISCYQSLKSKEISKDLYEEKLEKYNEQSKRLEIEFEELRRKEKIALSGRDTARRLYDEHDFDGNIRELEQQCDSIRNEIKEAENYISQINELHESIIILLNNPALGLAVDDDRIILKLRSEELNTDQKYSVLLSFERQVKDAKARFEETKFAIKKEIGDLDSKLSELCVDIKNLENKKRSFPRDVEYSRNRLQAKLQSEGINTDVHILAELVSKISRLEWQQAIECFMGNDRYSLIVEDKYVAQARDAYKALGISRPRLVLSDKIKSYSVEPCSLSSLLEIKNAEGRKYINYRFNHIHLCTDMKELHEHSQGGITVDGYRATGHSMDKMDISNINYTLGEDAVRLELERKNEMKRQTERLLSEKRKHLQATDECLTELEKNNLRAVNYRFEAIPEAKHLKAELRTIEETLKKLKSDPSFIALSNALEKANAKYEKARNEIEECSKRVAVCNNDIGNTRNEISANAAEIFRAQNELNEYELKHMDIKAAAREEYDKHISGHEDGIIYSDNTIRHAETDRQQKLSELVKTQQKFCQYAGIDILKSGEDFIGYFRNYRNDLVNVKAEETKQKLEETRRNLEVTFVTDFVAQVYENIKAAEKEIENINDELKSLPFGNHIYQFTSDKRSDKASFFKIAESLSPNDEDQLTLMSEPNEALENEINEFMDIILSESEGVEYEDYRSYLAYDMSINNRKNAGESFDLSKKQGSASNGEKQTPFFIILAASLMQCYPRSINCARLALIDEAFANLSDERIEQMVKYFEQNGFQVIYAAPPAKIKSIGAYISSTISLVEVGRYTKVVEGLVDDILKNAE